MSWNYENYLEGQLNAIVGEQLFKVEPELMYLEQVLDNDKVYVAVKYLSSSVTFGVIKETPIEILILGRPKDKKVEELQQIINQFVDANNYSQTKIDDQIVKQEYASPVLMEGFMEVGNTKRPVIYLSATLTILDGVVDIYDTNGDSTLTIDTNTINPLAFNFNYTMTPNTQPNSQEKIAISRKSSAGLSVALQIPSCSEYGTLIEKIMKIANSTNSGNTDFAFAWTIYGVSFTYNMKLVNCEFATLPNGAPSLVLAFMV